MYRVSMAVPPLHDGHSWLMTRRIRCLICEKSRTMLLCIFPMSYTTRCPTSPQLSFPTADQLNYVKYPAWYRNVQSRTSRTYRWRSPCCRCCVIHRSAIKMVNSTLRSTSLTHPYTLSSHLPPHLSTYLP